MTFILLFPMEMRRESLSAWATGSPSTAGDSSPLRAMLDHTGSESRRGYPVEWVPRVPTWVRIAKLRPFAAILRGIQADFFALQTIWRRECDTNLHYRLEFLSPDIVVTCSE